MKKYQTNSKREKLSDSTKAKVKKENALMRGG